MAEALTAILREDGIDVLLDTTTVRADATSAGGVVLTIRDAQGERQLEGSHLLVATGRTPNTGRLNLPATGVECDDKGYIRVDERLATNVEGVYALGDVKGGPAFTHISYDDYRIVRDNLLRERPAHHKRPAGAVHNLYRPRVGEGGAERKGSAADKGSAVRVASMPMSWVARAGEVGETRGLLKVLVDSQSDEILGCAMLGIAGGELMSMIEIAMMGHLPYTALRDGVFAHPTLAESLNTLFDQLA